MTIRAARGGRGLQPDQTYYLAHEPLVRGKDTYDPKTDPPPDLAIEVDVTNTSVPRLPVFAKIGIPEAWRLDRRRRLHFYRLKKTKYEVVQHSLAFAFLKPADVMRFVNRRSRNRRERRRPRVRRMGYAGGQEVKITGSPRPYSGEGRLKTPSRSWTLTPSPHDLRTSE